MDFSRKRAIVTGGTRGLGKGIADALAARGAHVTVVARHAESDPHNAFEAIAADITDRDAAMMILQRVQPDILVLNAGATPVMAPLDRISWQEFSVTWEADVQGGLYWIQAALNLPLAPGARVLVSSSGAAVNGSPMSGGYGGAKRMLWLMAKYANGIADKKGLDIRFQAIVPRQMIGGTGVGDAGAAAYGAAMGISAEDFLARFGAPMPPAIFGEQVATVLAEDRYDVAQALGFRGDDGVSVLEDVSA